jgi:hypothetical protein
MALGFIEAASGSNGNGHNGFLGGPSSEMRSFRVKVQGARMSFRYLDYPAVNHYVNPWDENQVERFEGELVPNQDSLLILKDSYARSMVLPDYPLLRLEDLRGRPVRIRWVWALLETEDGKRIDVALHDPSMVVEHSFTKLARGSIGEVKLTQAAWAGWNLSAKRTAAIRNFDELLSEVKKHGSEPHALRLLQDTLDSLRGTKTS